MNSSSRFIIFSVRAALVACCLSLAAAVCRAAFEDAPGGARTRGLGGAFTAVADTAESVFLQPAGSVLLDGPELSLTYGRLFWGLDDGSGISDTLLAFARPFGEYFGAGFGYRRLGLEGGMYTEQSFTAGVSWRPRDFLAAGLNLKYLNVSYGSDGYTQLDPVFASGSGKGTFDFDAGILVRPFPAVTVAYSRLNLAGGDLGLRERDAAAGQGRLGAAYREPNFAFTLETLATEGRRSYLAGAEQLFLRRQLAVRYGAEWTAGSLKKITVGLGATFRRYTLDYAWDCPLGGIEQTSGSHYVTLSARFFEPVKKERPDAATSSSALQLPGMPVPVNPAVVAQVSPSPAQGVTASTATVPVALLAQKVTSYWTLDVALYPEVFVREMIPRMQPRAPEPVPAPVPQIFVSSGAEAGLAVSTPAAVAPDYAPFLGMPRFPQELYLAIKLVREQEEEQARREAARAAAERLEREKRPAVVTHRVLSGETLPSLAEKYYGTKTLWTKIYDANRDKIEKGSLTPGQVLVIPRREE